MDITEIKTRLESFGYKFVDGDELAIEYAEGKAIQYIKHFCNISEIPECLDYVLMDMICGEFLQLKRNTGQLTSIQTEPIVKSIQDGDTRVEYNVSYQTDPAGVFNAFVDSLIKGHNDELIRHRRLLW